MSDNNDLIQDDVQVDFKANPSSYPFLKDLNLDQDVQRRLTLHLDRIKLGDSNVYTSPIGKDHNPSSVLESWDVIFHSKASEMNDALIKLELDNKAKFGPRSIAKPWFERFDSLKDYYSPKPKLSVDMTSDLHLSLKGRLRPLSVEAASKLLKNNTNSGLPYYKNKGLVKDRTVRKLEYLLSRRDPCILFTRTQEGNKTRNVWGYPCADTLEEMRYYRPVLSHQSNLSWRSALSGPDAVSIFITKIVREAVDNGYDLWSGDVSAFDACISPQLSDMAFYYIKLLFQYDFRAGLDRILDRFKSIPILTPSGIISGLHGVPSGSTFTNEVDSIVQYIILRSLGVKDSEMQIQGDDLALLLKSVSYDDVIKTYTSCGLRVNVDKSVLARNYVVYLQNLYHIDYLKDGVIGGIYPTYRALNRIIYQERWSDFEDFDIQGRDYYSIRTISILENCKHHPLFRDLVEFVFRLDKYSLRFSRDAVSKYVKMTGNASGTEGFMLNQYGDDVRGINGFETVKILKQLRK